MSSQQATAAKPSLQGTRIKQRKRTVKATAKHEPAVFRDQLYKHLETVPEGDFDSFTAKLVQAGSTLEFLKYAESLFEIILVGGLVQPGGGYVDDGAPVSPFTIFNAKEPVDIDDIKKYIEVLNRLIRRYKYLQKPLEEQALPTILQYIHKWSPAQKDKLCVAIGLLFSQGLASTSCLQSLTKDHLLKNDVSIDVTTRIFRAYLADQGVDHLSASLKRGGIKDLLAFFPPNKRDAKNLDEHFRKENLPQIADWWAKKQYAGIKDSLTKELQERSEQDETPEQIVAALRSNPNINAIPEAELVGCIWQGLMASVDWSARPDQIEGLALREVSRFAPIMEPFCSNAKTQVALINVVQGYCYEDTRVMKSFAQVLKVLYNKDCISDQAIIYWYHKGSKPQGRQHFLKATETLVKFLEQQDSDEEEDE